MKLTPQDVNRMSAENADRWMESKPEYWGAPENSVLICAFLESQIGRRFVWTHDNFEFVYSHLNELGVLKQRPPSQEQLEMEQAQAQQTVDEQAAAAQARQQAFQSEVEAQRQEVAELKQKPLSVLRQLATNSRVQDLKARGLTLVEVQERRR